MIIGIDGNEANVKNRVGIGEYAFELLKQFENFQFPACRQARPISCLPAGKANFQFRIYLKDKPIDDLPKEREGWIYRIIGPKKLWTQFGLPIDLYLHKPRPDVFFTPTHYAPRFSPISTVISIMDLSYMHYPEMFKKSDLLQLKSWTKYSAKKAEEIMTISNASKDDIIKIYKVAKEKVIVTYPGIKKLSVTNQELLTMEEIKNKYGISNKYILFVGTIQPRKNLLKLIEAFSKLIRENEEYSSLFLVIVGKKGWLYEEILEAPKKYGVEEQVLFLHNVSNEDLSIIYKNALCFVLPSLYEGFGLPVLEAMENGCPVVTSNVSSLPEAAGEAALYVDPQDSDDIVKKIMVILNDSKSRKELIEKGYQQVKKFSWEKTAKETLKVLEKVGKNTN